MAEFVIVAVPELAEGCIRAYEGRTMLSPRDKQDLKDWQLWCLEHGIDAMTGGRRAWITEISSYLRGADYLVLRNGSIAGLGYKP